MNKGLFWVVLALIAMVFVSGCTSSGEEERQTYSQQVETSNGPAVVNTNMPVKVLSITDPLTTRQMDRETWYAVEMDTIVSNMYSFSISIKDVEDLENLDISAKLPSGGTASVKNLDVEKVNGDWQLTGEFDGIDRIGFWDGVEDPVVFFWEGEAITLPELVKDDFIFMFYVDTTYVDPVPAAAQTPVATVAAPVVQTSRFTQQVNTVNGLVEINTTVAVEPTARTDTRTMAEMNYFTWYCVDTSPELPGSYAAMAKNVEPTDLQKVDINFKLPNGNVASVQNLRVAQVNGKWQLEGDYEGIFGIGVWDGYEANEPHIYVELDKPVVLPDFVGQQDFELMVYVNTAYSGV